MNSGTRIVGLVTVPTPTGTTLPTSAYLILICLQMLNKMNVQEHRITESDLVGPVLVYLATQPNGFATTSDLISHLVDLFKPSGEDAEILLNRSDTKFSQKVRNLISHRDQPSGIVGRRLCEYDRCRRGLTITEYGRRYIESTAVN